MKVQEYQQEEIRKALVEMSSIFYDLHGYKDYMPESEALKYETYEHVQFLEENFEFYAKRIKLLVITYFESLNQNRFLQQLESEIEPFYKETKDLYKASYDDGDYATSSLITTYRNLLSIFPGFLDTNTEILKRSGLIYLEHILESTHIIINKLEKKPKSEVEVYNAVKIVCEATFANAEFLHFNMLTPTEQNTFQFTAHFTPSFQTQVKCYKPDILIPSLNCAIEYKYAESETSLIKTIEDILIDVKGYSNNFHYRIFYAVFYVKIGIWSRQRFNQVWTEKGFPENWKGIMVEGEM